MSFVNNDVVLKVAADVKLVPDLLNVPFTHQPSRDLNANGPLSTL